ncbi:hypothetical protein SBA5_200028 [Candidatus Sulfotelmatomonas gaucii]|uniref:HPr kinase n=1 Tax=Candidatus Sulfuritelmatomonas gaucii TaxID=2043161 RepID=A0A2N9L756_9BACT|nr:hypothetical protein SBA5_200028 [Candidatus Sulfotelmatomonas gaucii]
MLTLSEDTDKESGDANCFPNRPVISGFDVCAFGCHLRLTAMHPDALDVFQHFVFPSLPRTAPGREKPDLCIRIEAGEGQYQLFADNAIIASAPEARDLVVGLIRVLDETVVGHLKALHAVHAGAILWRGRVLLLPGKSHAGKSSLVAELLRQGATYFTDEYALIDRNGLVYPYPRPLLLRNGRPDQVPAFAEECNARVGAAAAPVRLILLVAYKPDGAWSIEPISQGIALLHLLQNTPHVLTDSPGMVESFQRAVAGARCYAGTRGDAVEAARLILCMMDESS